MEAKALFLFLSLVASIIFAVIVVYNCTKAICASITKSKFQASGLEVVLGSITISALWVIFYILD